MTVKELREMLAGMPEDATILVPCHMEPMTAWQSPAAPQFTKRFGGNHVIITGLVLSVTPLDTKQSTVVA